MMMQADVERKFREYQEKNYLSKGPEVTLPNKQTATLNPLKSFNINLAPNEVSASGIKYNPKKSFEENIGFVQRWLNNQNGSMAKVKSLLNAGVFDVGDNRQTLQYYAIHKKADPSPFVDLNEVNSYLSRNGSRFNSSLDNIEKLGSHKYIKYEKINIPLSQRDFIVTKSLDGEILDLGEALSEADLRKMIQRSRALPSNASKPVKELAEKMFKEDLQDYNVQSYDNGWKRHVSLGGTRDGNISYQDGNIVVNLGDEGTPNHKKMVFAYDFGNGMDFRKNIEYIGTKYAHAKEIKQAQERQLSWSGISTITALTEELKEQQKIEEIEKEAKNSMSQIVTQVKNFFRR